MKESFEHISADESLQFLGLEQLVELQGQEDLRRTRGSLGGESDGAHSVKSDWLGPRFD